MDVRCDKCGTEYELDESQLKPSGVTVKCTTCGHLFRVRGRGATSVGMGVVSPPAEAGPHSGPHRAKTESGRLMRAESSRAAPSVSPASGIPAAVSGQSSSGKSRHWLVRLPTGDVETCHELATLQQWIVSGRVSRNSGISRTGKTWKKLGDIAELASFFRIAEEARAARRERSAAMPMPTAEAPNVLPNGGLADGSPNPFPKPTIRPTIQPSAPARAATPAPTRPEPAAPRAIVSTETTDPLPAPHMATGLPVVMVPPEPAPTPLPAPALAEPAPSAPVAPAAQPASSFAGVASNAPVASAAQPASSFAGVDPVVPAFTAVPAAGPAASRSPRESNEWSDALMNPESEIQGPRGGMARGVPTTDVAFGKSRIRPLDEFEDDEPDLHDDHVAPSGGGAGKWIVGISLVVMAGAAFALYFLVFRSPGQSAATEISALAQADAGAVTLDAGSGSAVAVRDQTPDGGAAAPAEDPGAVLEALLADADAAVLAFDTDALARADAQLSALPEAGTDPAILLARARISLALAQEARDSQALATDREAAKQFERQAEERVLAALPWVKKALESDRKSASGNALMADIMRLQGQSSRTVERYLREVRKADKTSREADLVQALFYVDDKRSRKGRPMLEKLERGDGAMDKSGDIRPSYRLAFLDVSAEAHEEARARVNAILAYAPSHPGARALLERIRQATTVSTADPLPPEDDGGGSDQGSSNDDSYAGLLARADKKAENGDCDAALELYEKAVDIDPLGVAALTGMGYCYIDRGRYASAHDKFKAALVASPNYQEALWGIAEAYQQAGQKELAVKAYQRFVAAHPNGQRADMAKRQIERLGGSLDGSGGGQGTGGQDSGGQDSGGQGSGGQGSGGQDSGGTGQGSAGQDTGTKDGAGGTSSSGGNDGASKDDAESKGDTGGGASGASGDKPDTKPDPSSTSAEPASGTTPSDESGGAP